MPTTHSIQLRFIRRAANGQAEENSDLDDTLIIQKLSENNLRVTYTERTVDGTLTDMTQMTYQKMVHYVSRILWLMTLDADPFNSVQLMIPGYPMVLIPVARIQEQAALILDLLINTCWHWPTAGRTVPPATPNRTRFATEPTVPELLREASLVRAVIGARPMDLASGSSSPAPSQLDQASTT